MVPPSLEKKGVFSEELWIPLKFFGYYGGMFAPSTGCLTT